MNMQTQLVSYNAAWADLKTVTTFDAGGITHCADTMAENNRAVLVRNCTQSSLLIESLLEQLCNLLVKEPDAQKKLFKVICGKLRRMKLIDNSYNLEEFEPLRGLYQQALFSLVSVAKSTVDGSEPNSIVRLSSPNLELASTLLADEDDNELLKGSRYSTDFVELHFIAKGGFGQVFKVRHKLDGEDYAIKKIFLRCRNIERFYRTIREVKLLAKLNHPNIVSYKAAWLEPLYTSTTQHNVSPEDSSPDDFSSTHSHLHRKKTVTKSSDAENSSSVVFKDSRSEKNNSMVEEEIVYSARFGNSGSSKVKKTVVSEVHHSYHANTTSTSSIIRTDMAASWRNDSLSHVFEVVEEESQSFKKSLKDNAVCLFTNCEENVLQEKINKQEWAVLYIQMQFCSSTLRHWLNKRNSSVANGTINVQESLRIFRDIVHGVSFIHSKGIVHHDLKPGNVFTNGTDASDIKVGDFGLACYLQHSESVLLMTSHDHGCEMGTKLYAAPEQLGGKCVMKSDVYSLGIILFELLRPFGTDMERSIVLSKLRTSTDSLNEDIANPELVLLIKNLLASNPKERPSAEDLLQQLEALLRESPCTNGGKDDETTIQKLRKELLRKEQEIEELRKRVKELESASQT